MGIGCVLLSVSWVYSLPHEQFEGRCAQLRELRRAAGYMAQERDDRGAYALSLAVRPGLLFVCCR